MKKIFATFCALVLMPMFSAQAWIGGPFSNNTYFGENGDDGVYEAVATGPNALGIYRIVVGNNFEGVNPGGVSDSADPSSLGFNLTGGTLSANYEVGLPTVFSGNSVLGALGRAQNHVWFFEGVSYTGFAVGTASSTLGIVAGIGSAQQSSDLLSRVNSVPADFQFDLVINSSFRASMEKSGRFLPSSAFSGAGRGRLTGSSINPQNNPPFRFLVFGSKVSSQILFGL